MRRTYVGLCVLLCTLVGGSAALAATRGARSEGTIQTHRLSPERDGRMRCAGIVVDKKYGDGAITFLNKPSADAVTGTFKAYYDGGTVSGTHNTKVTYNPDGTAKLTDGHMKITKGTGAFKGAKGTGTYSGSATSDGLVTATYRMTMTRAR
jgi:hypothetical protein